MYDHVRHPASRQKVVRHSGKSRNTASSQSELVRVSQWSAAKGQENEEQGRPGQQRLSNANMSSKIMHSNHGEMVEKLEISLLHTSLAHSAGNGAG